MVRKVESLATQVASRWGKYADNEILKKLQDKLHKDLLMWIKRQEVNAKLKKGEFSHDDAELEMKMAEQMIDYSQGNEPKGRVDTTRPD